jgi:hypothetical protein
MLNRRLTSGEVQALVKDNQYKINEKTKYLSRCIDGRYENSPDLPALGLPGADAGDLAALYATANIYGFTVDTEKALKTLLEIVGGPEHFSFHTDARSHDPAPTSGDGHFKKIRQDPEAYNLTPDQLHTITKQIEKLEKKGAKETVLHGDHREGALLLIKGNCGVLPKYTLQTDNGSMNVEVFVFHAGLVNERHKAWAQKLVEEKAVELVEKLDEEYLYEVLSTTTDDHLFETANRLAKTLPIYEVTFKDFDNFVVEERGSI